MTLEATFRQLAVSLHQLHEALNALQVTVGDKPPDDEAALADGLESAVLAMRGTLHDARKAALAARGAVEHPVDLDQARRALATCQEQCHIIDHQFSADLVSYEKLWELARLGSERGREWLPWSNSVKQAIEDCRLPLQEVGVALSRCWQELAERLGTTSISVHATNVGQQIKVPASMAADLETEGVS